MRSSLSSGLRPKKVDAERHSDLLGVAAGGANRLLTHDYSWLVLSDVLTEGEGVSSWHHLDESRDF